MAKTNQHETPQVAVHKFRYNYIDPRHDMPTKPGNKKGDKLVINRNGATPDKIVKWRR